MKPKYSIGEIVRIKATGEKVKIDDVSIWENKNIYWDHSGGYVKWYEESELKPFRPSRTGKFRNAKGQFVSNGHRPTHNMKIIGNWNICLDCFFRERIKQQSDKKIEKLANADGVKMSSTVGGQRELIRQYRNKINEIIDRVNSMEVNHG